MVIASKNAANRLTHIAISITDKKLSTIPKDNASSALIAPVTIGLFCVLFILLSISLSYHILMLAAEPAPRVIQTIEVKAIKG